MPHDVRCCDGTYRRDRSGWHYEWGDQVPGAIDLTLADLWRIGGDLRPEDPPCGLRALGAEERAWLSGDTSAADQVRLHDRPGQAPNAGDLIVGLLAPELHPALMLTLADVADLAGVSKPTADSYRYRGLLPDPQAVVARTPLWARPVIKHWMECRPGSGWRGDVYRGSTPPERVIDLDERTATRR